MILQTATYGRVSGGAPRRYPRRLPMSERLPSTYAVLEQHGVDRRTFFKYCTSLAAIMGLEASMVPKAMAAIETKPRLPATWRPRLECTCCSESFIRSSHPIAQDLIQNMVSLDYDDTLQAAAGEQAEEVQIRR